jgi:putative chitinase
MLFIGQKLCIPVANARPEQQQPRQLLADDGKYTVRSGDSLYLIAKRLGVSQSELQKINDIDDPNLLQVGQKLTIPEKKVKEAAAVVPASRPSTLKSDRRGASPVGSQIAKPARQPSPASDQDKFYTIRSGDTISQIANDLGVSRGDLMELNNLTPTSPLRPGKNLLIPTSRKASPEKIVAADDDFFDNFDDIPVVEVDN